MLTLTQNPTQVNKLETDLCGDHKHFDQKQCADQNSSETTEPNSAWWQVKCSESLGIFDIKLNYMLLSEIMKTNYDIYKHSGAILI